MRPTNRHSCKVSHYRVYCPPLFVVAKEFPYSPFVYQLAFKTFHRSHQSYPEISRATKFSVWTCPRHAVNPGLPTPYIHGLYDGSQYYTTRRPTASLGLSSPLHFPFTPNRSLIPDRSFALPICILGTIEQCPKVQMRLPCGRSCRSVLPIYDPQALVPAAKTMWPSNLHRRLRQVD
ncbi:hypothetical protein CPB86DRAFT_339621 [Serendipita vermifera]|nr:hypothetical protein CPB86DRAFT_339621 [Serendipita vermifera]